jgi:hypothetical protein
MKTLFATILLFLFITNGIAQTQDTLIQQQLGSTLNSEEKIAYKKSHTDFYILRKGRLFASWGYNRSTYGKSTINFVGNGYDFTIKNAKANDKPEKFSWNVYFNPGLITIPQYNFRIGYFITNKLSLSLNVDHMKYVLDNAQTATVDGFIDSSASKKWANDYDNKQMPIDRNFIGYEHTDGLNVISLELDYHDLIFETDSRKFAVDLVAGVGLGATVPKTNAYLFGEFGNDAFHLAGGGVTGNVGFKLYLFKHFFIHPTTKFGYLMMPNVATNGLEIDKASQNISFFQGNFTIGFQYKIAHK